PRGKRLDRLREASRCPAAVEGAPDGRADAGGATVCPVRRRRGADPAGDRVYPAGRDDRPLGGHGHGLTSVTPRPEASRGERLPSAPLTMLRAAASHNHSTSKIHSTSTAIPPGRALVPIALRAPTPLSSPNTSAINSEKPLITFGWSPNSGVDRTRPS